MRFDDAADEYVEALQKLAAEQQLEGAVHLGAYARFDGEIGKLSGEVTPYQAALVLAHMRDTLRLVGRYRYRELEL